MTATIPFGAQALGQIGVMPMQTLGALSGFCAVHLIDRRTGAGAAGTGRGGNVPYPVLRLLVTGSLQGSFALPWKQT